MRSLIVIPTYNERENIGELLTQVFAAAPATDALVIDDNSPDGTGQVVDEIAARDPRVHVAAPGGQAGPWHRLRARLPLRDG